MWCSGPFVIGYLPLLVADLRLPADKGTYSRLAYANEKMLNNVIRRWNLVDTRDVGVDGMTKRAP